MNDFRKCDSERTVVCLGLVYLDLNKYISVCVSRGRIMVDMCCNLCLWIWTSTAQRGLARDREGNMPSNSNPEQTIQSGSKWKHGQQKSVRYQYGHKIKQPINILSFLEAYSSAIRILIFTSYNVLTTRYMLVIQCIFLDISLLPRHSLHSLKNRGA